MASNFPEIIQVSITAEMKSNIDLLKEKTGFGMPFIIRPMIEKGVAEALAKHEADSDV